MSLSRCINELREKGEVYLGVKEVMEDGTLKFSVKAPADKGKANQELVRFLAKELGVTKDDISIINGWTSRSKLIKIER
jgi:hypothetical protein